MLIRACLLFVLLGCDFAPEPTPFEGGAALSSSAPDETGVFVSALTVDGGEGVVTLAGVPGSTKGGGKMRAVNTRTMEAVLFPSHDDGSFAALLEVQAGDVVRVTWRLKDEDAESLPLEITVPGGGALTDGPGRGIPSVDAAKLKEGKMKIEWFKWTTTETLLMTVPTETLPESTMVVLANMTNGRSRNAFARQDGAFNMEFFAGAGDTLHVFAALKGFISPVQELIAPEQ